MVWLLIFLLIVVFVCFYRWATNNNNYFTHRGIPHGTPKFLLGTSYELVKKKVSVYEYVQNWYNRFPSERIIGLYEFKKPFYFIRDPELAAELCIKQFEFFPDHKNVANDDPLMSNTLMSLKGEKWKEMRSILSPAFSGSKLRMMFRLVKSSVLSNISAVTNEIQNTGSFEMKSFFSNFTIDIIATCAFGIEINSFKDPNNEFQVMAGKVMTRGGFKMLMKFIGFRLVPSLMKLMNVKILSPEVGDLFREKIIDAFDYRKQRNIVRPDMIHLLIEATSGKLTDDDSHVIHEKKKPARVWKEEEIIAQCMTFYLAGFKTTSTALSLAAYELAANVEIQEKLRAEIKASTSKLESSKVPFEELQKLKYLDQFVCELLRKWPPAAGIERECVKDFKLQLNGKSITIEKGIDLLIPIYAIHRDAKYYEEPDKFNPDRFADENIDKVDPKAYFPFGIGRRRCIGSRFAQDLVIKTVLFYMLERFEFEINEHTQIPLKFKKSLAVESEKGVWMNLKKI